MSYLVLARKYRPRNFAEMVGQEHVVQALTNALTQQRLHHAYLFTGTRGVGKTTVSRILAKSLNCTGADGQGGITATPCGVCPACTEIDAGRFVDYTELDAASNRGVGEVQALLEQAVYKPVQGRFKVFMIDEVHMLSTTAFNAMLKTLEEPPEYLKFVLATTDPQKVPVTVLSRCLQFNLRPMAPEVVLGHLQQVLEQEQVPAEPQALRLLARGARGSMRDALSLTDQAIAYGSGALHEAGVRQMLGTVDRSVVFGLIEALAQGEGRRVVELVDGLRSQGQSASGTLEDMADILQRMAVCQLAGGDSGDDSDPDAQETARLAALLPADETQLLYSLCIHGRKELGLAPDEYAGLCMALLRLLPFKAAPAEKKTLKPGPAPAPAAEAPPPAPAFAVPAPPAPAVPEQAPEIPAPSPPAAATTPVAGATRAGADFAPPEAEPAGEPDLDAEWAAMAGAAPAAVDDTASAPTPAVVEPAPAPVPEPVAPPPLPVSQLSGSASPVDDAAGHEAWHSLVQTLVEAESITALARQLALQSQRVAQVPGRWTLRVDQTSLAQPGTVERLQTALAEAGHAVQLQVEIGPVTDTPAQRRAIAAAQRLKQAEALLLADPFVQEMMRDFGATIVPGSIKPL